MTFSEPLMSALARYEGARSDAIHRCEVALAALHLEHGPPGAREQLALAMRFLGGAATVADLAEARQECWLHAGSLACGCSAADAATSASFLALLDGSAGAHTPASLAEQVERALRAGVSEARVLAALRNSSPVY